jgi:hypothetical protein
MAPAKAVHRTSFPPVVGYSSITGLPVVYIQLKPGLRLPGDMKLFIHPEYLFHSSNIGNRRLPRTNNSNLPRNLVTSRGRRTSGYKHVAPSLLIHDRRKPHLSRRAPTRYDTDEHVDELLVAVDSFTLNTA